MSCAIHLAFACSLRLGEITGLTWDCVTISGVQDDFEAYLCVDKELQRVTNRARKHLSNYQIIKVFPERMVNSKSRLVLKRPKTQASMRKVWLPKSVAEMLEELKGLQQSIQQTPYVEYGLVFSDNHGFPIEGTRLSKAFNELVVRTGLPQVVFHSLRHTSVTYKLRLNHGDVKAVQGDTGHVQMKMVYDVYARIMDEGRREIATKIENNFYAHR